MINPPIDCKLCPRLVEFRKANQKKFPDFHNAPVAAFGALDARLLIVGLAPGLKGANATGRPFTGDWAGDLLYSTLLAFNWASGTYDQRPDDGLTLIDARITNAVRCVPPENKVIGAETKNCRPFLINEMAAMPNLQAIMCLGLVSHNAVLSAIKARKADYKFAHGAEHEITLPDDRTVKLSGSYHCSRYNTNTGRLTEDMFHDVFRLIGKAI